MSSVLLTNKRVRNQKVNSCVVSLYIMPHHNNVYILLYSETQLEFRWNKASRRERDRENFIFAQGPSCVILRLTLFYSWDFLQLVSARSVILALLVLLGQYVAIYEEFKESLVWRRINSQLLNALCVKWRPEEKERSTLPHNGSCKNFPAKFTLLLFIFLTL